MTKLMEKWDNVTDKIPALVFVVGIIVVAMVVLALLPDFSFFDNWMRQLGGLPPR